MARPPGYDAPINLTSPTQVKAWCQAHEFHPSKNLGQNFLIDRNVLDAIVKAAALPENARVLEIGPGLGVLTAALLEQGATVTAVEKDTRLAARLAQALGTPPGLTVIAADALKLDWQNQLAAGCDACVSNLPYSVGTRILLDLALHPLAPPRFVVLVQTEVAERFAATHESAARGQAGVWLQLDYSVRIVRHVKPACFWPRPEVNSSIVRLDRHPSNLTATERTWFMVLTRHAFTQRRKQLGTVLRKAPAPFKQLQNQVDMLLEQAGLAAQIRAERVTNAQWQHLARACAAACSGQAAL